MKRRLFLLFANMLGLSSASRASVVESAGVSPSETGSSSAHARATTPNGFDWRRTSARRPVFTVDYWRMILLPLWIMLLFFIALGIGFWLVRRR